MPLYEYECGDCGRRFEQIQKFSDPPAEKCPTCGGKVRKLMSSPAIQFKGSGWYITDYAKKDSGSGDKADKGEKSDKAGKSGESASSDGKTESKAETKSESKTESKSDTKSGSTT